MFDAFGNARLARCPARRPPTASAVMLLALAFLLSACSGGGGPGPQQQPPPAPTASFTVSPQQGEAPLTVTFDASASQAGSGVITSYSWQFGDGATGSGVQVEHTYAEPGDFQPRLTVTNTADRTGTATRSVTAESPPGTFTVSGTLLIGSASAVDGSTNDPNVPSPISSDNSDLDLAQAVTPPIVIGGYLARAGAGPEGATQPLGDASDFYRFQAAGGERVELVIGNPNLDSNNIARNDLDLYLYDASGALVAQSLGTGPTDSLDVPEAGSFTLEVAAFSGASTYVVTIGGSSSGMAGHGRDATAVIPGEIILGPERIQAAAVPAPVAYQMVAGRDPAQMRLARLEQTSAGTGLRRQGGQEPSGRLAALDRSPLPKARERYATLEAVKLLRHSGRYEWVEPNYLREAQQVKEPNDPLFEDQWHYSNIQLPLAWERTEGSPDVHVAVLDTGVLSGHPDLQGQLLPGYDFVANVPGAEDPGDGGGGGASSFHGTHVAGTVAARTDNGLGVAGVGWSTRVLPVRVLGQGGGSSFDVMEGVRYAAGMASRAPSPPERPVDIINLSLGGPGLSESEQELFDDVRALGIFVVAAAGNQGSSNPFFPASYDGVLAVSATRRDNQLASYSNFGPQIDLAAPGGEPVFDGAVLSTVGRVVSDGEDSSQIEFVYQGRAGTSMAAPHVAGVIALMKAVNPDLTPELFQQLLMTGALTDDLGAPGPDDQFGWGLINARKAVLAAEQAADGSLEIPASVSASPRALDFGPFGETASLTLSNAGTLPAKVVGVMVDQPWLSVAEDNVEFGSGLGSYAVGVERGSLADGTYQGQIVFQVDEADDVTVPVTMRVASSGIDADAGFHYIVLADPDSGEVVRQVTAVAVDGRYDFVFEDVPEGSYELYAGTDMNNNFFVCDEVEACALFPTLDAPDILVVDEDITGIEFVTGFRSVRFDAPADVEAASETRRRQRARAPKEVHP